MNYLKHISLSIWVFAFSLAVVAYNGFETSEIVFGEEKKAYNWATNIAVEIIKQLPPIPNISMTLSDQGSQAYLSLNCNGTVIEFNNSLVASILGVKSFHTYIPKSAIGDEQDAESRIKKSIYLLIGLNDKGQLNPFMESVLYVAKKLSANVDKQYTYRIYVDFDNKIASIRKYKNETLAKSAQFISYKKNNINIGSVKSITGVYYVKIDSEGNSNYSFMNKKERLFITLETYRKMLFNNWCQLMEEEFDVKIKPIQLVPIYANIGEIEHKETQQPEVVDSNMTLKLSGENIIADKKIAESMVPAADDDMGIVEGMLNILDDFQIAAVIWKSKCSLFN